ncbi:MAG: hypothetical protein ABI634_14055 [Acidobacteriota bacterium]
MRSRSLIIAVLLAIATALVALPVRLLAVGTVTTTSTAMTSTLTRISIAWTSTAGGAVSGNAFATKRARIRQVKFVPGAGGTQPTDLYDVTLVDANGVDLLFGAGADLSNATSKIARLDPMVLIEPSGTVDLVVANAGSAKTGTVLLWVE